MSRTWKDKIKHHGLSRLNFKKRCAEQRQRFQQVKENATRDGFDCSRCWMLDKLEKGLKCSEHGGGIKDAIFRKAGISVDAKK